MTKVLPVWAIRDKPFTSAQQQIKKQKTKQTDFAKILEQQINK